jgi:hypothetical protein
MGKWGSRYLNAITLSAHFGLLLASIVVAIKNTGKHETWLICAFISYS